MSERERERILSIFRLLLFQVPATTRLLLFSPLFVPFSCVAHLLQTPMINVPAHYWWLHLLSVRPSVGYFGRLWNKRNPKIKLVDVQQTRKVPEQTGRSSDSFPRLGCLFCAGRRLLIRKSPFARTIKQARVWLPRPAGELPVAVGGHN